MSRGPRVQRGKGFGSEIPEMVGTWHTNGDFLDESRHSICLMNLLKMIFLDSLHEVSFSGHIGTELTIQT